MATRAEIGIQVGKGKAMIIYSHWDGYPKGVGSILLKSYTDPKKVKQLMELGDISSLRDEIGEKHDLSSDYELAKKNQWTSFYHRDRGDVLNKAVIVDLKKLTAARNKTSIMQDYIYIMDSSKTWWVMASEDSEIQGWMKLSDVLKGKVESQPKFMEMEIGMNKKIKEEEMEDIRYASDGMQTDERSRTGIKYIDAVLDMLGDEATDHYDVGGINKEFDATDHFAEEDEDPFDIEMNPEDEDKEGEDMFEFDTEDEDPAVYDHMTSEPVDKMIEKIIAKKK